MSTRAWAPFTDLSHALTFRWWHFAVCTGAPRHGAPALSPVLSLSPRLWILCALIVVSCWKIERGGGVGVGGSLSTAFVPGTLSFTLVTGLGDNSPLCGISMQEDVKLSRERRASWPSWFLLNWIMSLDVAQESLWCLWWKKCAF